MPRGGGRTAAQKAASRRNLAIARKRRGKGGSIKKRGSNASFNAWLKKVGDKQRRETSRLSIRAKAKKYGPSPVKGGGPKRISQKVKFGGSYFVAGQGVKSFNARPRLRGTRVKR